MLKDLFYIESINKESENRITAIAGMNGKNPVFWDISPGSRFCRVSVHCFW